MVSKERHGPWALIVGGSEGIASALAAKLAATGIDLVLVARNPEALASTAETARLHGADVRTLALDVASPDAVDRIRAVTEDIEIGLFIHNVGGGGGFGPFLDRTLDENMQSVMVNCVNLVQLVHHYGRPMKHRGSGGIIMFGSMAGNVGSANIATYSAGKAFVQMLCESIWSELKDSGVDVLNIVIGSADTPARQRSGAQDSPMFPVATAEAVSEQAFREISNGPVQVPLGSERAFEAFNIPDRRSAVEIIRRMLADMRVA